MSIGIELVLSVVVLVLCLQLLLNAFHRRDIESERLQAFDMGRKSGIEQYKESWQEAQREFAEKQQRKRQERDEINNQCSGDIKA